MATKVRPTVFETNSSATHSLTIFKSWRADKYKTLKLNRKDQLVLKGGEFERERADYSDALTKANYCAVYAKLQAECNSEHYLSMLTKVLREHTGATEVVYDFTVGYDNEGEKNYSCINHQAAEDCTPAFEDENTLRKFIFDPRSWLHIDADG